MHFFKELQVINLTGDFQEKKKWARTKWVRKLGWEHLDWSPLVGWVLFRTNGAVRERGSRGRPI